MFKAAFGDGVKTEYIARINSDTGDILDELGRGWIESWLEDKPPS